jgi:hypothetical protein
VLAATQISGGPATSIIVMGSTPATCSPGQVVFVTGTGLYQCTATNTWTQVPLASGGSAITATAVYGDGSDGAVTFDGTSTVLGLVPSGDVYTMTRDIYCSSITVNSAATIITAGFKIFCNGTLANAGVIQANGAAGSAGTGGAGFSVGLATFIGSSGSGGAGGNNGVGSGGGGRSVNTTYDIGGAGGAGGAATNSGGSGGSVVAPSGASSNVHSLPTAISGTEITIPGNANGVRGFNGGTGGGGGGSSAATATGGGGGAGGFIVGIYAKTITNTGAIEALGGAGAAGSGSAANAGGGGGGGGGVVILIYNSLTAGTISVAGGAPGAGFGTGATGVTGSTGLLVEIPNNN